MIVFAEKQIIEHNNNGRNSVGGLSLQFNPCTLYQIVGPMTLVSWRVWCARLKRSAGWSVNYLANALWSLRHLEAWARAQWRP